MQRFLLALTGGNGNHMPSMEPCIGGADSHTRPLLMSAYTQKSSLVSELRLGAEHRDLKPNLQWSYPARQFPEDGDMETAVSKLLHGRDPSWPTPQTQCIEVYNCLLSAYVASHTVCFSFPWNKIATHTPNTFQIFLIHTQIWVQRVSQPVSLQVFQFNTIQLLWNWVLQLNNSSFDIGYFNSLQWGKLE